MKFWIAAVGRAKAGPERELFDHYARRLNWPTELREVEERKAMPTAKRKEREAALLLAALPDGAVKVVLDEKGRGLTSRAFAQKIDKWQGDGHHDIALLIGGADGHGAAVRQSADLLLSLGTMTWPHMLVRGLVAEQIFRAQCILSRHPYHRD